MCLMSAPAAKKPSTAELTTTTLAWVTSSESIAACRPLTMSGLRALAGAPFSTISTIAPSRFQSTGSGCPVTVNSLRGWWIGSRHGQAAADRQRLAGDVLRGVGGEERDGGGDGGRVCQPLHRHRAGHAADHFLGVLP